MDPALHKILPLVAESIPAVLPRHTMNLLLEHNPHLQGGEGKVEEFEGVGTWVSELQKQKATATNEMWMIAYSVDETPKLAISQTVLKSCDLFNLLKAADDGPDPIENSLSSVSENALPES
jgi:hypothetical protein